MTYLQPFQESCCETWKVGDGYGYSLSSSKKLVPRSSWNFDSTKRMVPRSSWNFDSTKRMVPSSNSGSDSLKCRIEMQKPNLKWKFPDAKIEQNWCETMFSGYWFFPELQVGLGFDGHHLFFWANNLCLLFTLFTYHKMVHKLDEDSWSWIVWFGQSI